MSTALLLILITHPQLLFSQANYSNNNKPKVVLVEADYSLNLPIGTFKEKTDKWIHGINTSVYRQLKYDKPQFLGLRLSYSVMATERGDYIDSFGFDTDRKVTGNRVGLHFAYRIYPKGYYWKFDPFLSAFMGTEFLYTTINDRDVESEEGVAFNIENFNASLSYGMMAGTHFNISEYVLLSLKLAYQSSTISSYLVEDDLSQFNPLNRFEIKSSSMESFNLLFGLTFAF